MSSTYHLNKHCPVCGKLLADKNKGNYIPVVHENGVTY